MRGACATWRAACVRVCVCVCRRAKQRTTSPGRQRTACLPSAEGATAGTDSRASVASAGRWRVSPKGEAMVCRGEEGKKVEAGAGYEEICDVASHRPQHGAPRRQSQPVLHILNSLVG